jgi:hypothetical protein
MGNQESTLRQGLVQAAGKKLVIMVLIDTVDLPVEPAFPLEQKTARIPKRAR